MGPEYIRPDPIVRTAAPFGARSVSVAGM